MTLGNTAWKLRGAVEALAASTHSLQERLENVYLSYLLPLDRAGHEWDFPPAVRPEIAAIHERMRSARPVGDEGTVRATINSMTDDEAVGVAQAIVALSYHVEEALAEQGDIRFPKTRDDPSATP